MIPGGESPPVPGQNQPQDGVNGKAEMGAPIQDNDIEVNVDRSTKMPEKGLGEI